MTKILGFEDPETASMATVTLSKDVDRDAKISKSRILFSAKFTSYFLKFLYFLSSPSYKFDASLLRSL